MTYQEFKTFLTTFLWRDGDTVLISNLDSLIKMAETEMNRVLKVEDRTVTADASITDNILTVPIDYREMRNMSIPGRGPLTYLSPLQFARVEATTGNGNWPLVFTVSNRLIRLLGNFNPQTPVPVTMVYYANVPDFKAEDESWVAEDYLDVYTYCALKHAAPFLREDDRLQVWKDLYGTALQTALEENANRKNTGSPQRITYGGGQ